MTPSSGPTTHSLFIVEDHPVMREGYLALLRSELDLEVCGEAASAEEALLRIEATQPDLVLLDLRLPGTNGIELIKRIQKVSPESKILVISAHEESLYAERALRAGAQGYLTKHESSTHAIVAIRTVLRGETYFSDALRSHLLDSWIKGGGNVAVGVNALSDREIEVFEHLGRGQTTREIAEALRLSPKTIESHRANIKSKLGISTSPELTQRAVLWLERTSN